MMKRKEFNIPAWKTLTFFSAIRSKLEIISLLMDTLNFCLKNTISSSIGGGKVVFYVNKMNRLFYQSDDKYFSIINPFLTIEDDSGNLNFSFQNIIIDYTLISIIQSIIKNNNFNTDILSFDIIEKLDEYGEQFDMDILINGIILLKYLLLMEDGYIRYDYDEENYEKYKAKGMEHYHPLNHYDFFYSSGQTFKLGLSRKISLEEFIDLVDTTTACTYLNC